MSESYKLNKFKPFFSVIIPTHNRPNSLSEALESVLAQNFENFEIIIINDSSNDDYTTIENRLKKDERIEYYRVNYKNRSKTRNFGIDKARGKWICFLDDDDIYYDNHLQVLYNKIIETNEEHRFYHTFTTAKNNGELAKKHKDYTRKHKGKRGMFEGIPPIHTIAVKSKILENERFNPKYHFWEDMDLWLRVIGDTEICLINTFTVEYRFHDNNTVNDFSLENLKKQGIFSK